MNQPMNESFKIVRDDINHMLELSEGVEHEENIEKLKEFIANMRVICERDLRILKVIK